ncbi:hypothetical protein ACOMHN_006744 [Nucella lapillus]
MDTFTQTSTCGCSGKHSALSSNTPTRHHRDQHHHQRRQSVRSLALQPVSSVDLRTEDHGNLSLASLHIQALRPPETRLSTSAGGVASGTEDGRSRQFSDYPYPHGGGDCVPAAWNQNRGEQHTTEIGAVSKGENNKVNKSATISGLTSRKSSLKTRPETELEKGNRVVSRGRTPHYVTYGHSNQNQTSSQQNDVTDARRKEADSRGSLDPTATNGEFISRRPPPAAFRSKNGLRQQRERTSRERCRSGVTPAGGDITGQKVTSVARARRGKSAGDLRYCGRPCDACSIQKLQDWAKKLYVTRSASNQGQHPPGKNGGGGGGWGGGSGEGGQGADLAPVTRVTLPGRGLPKLTGLQHELDDPSYYDRRRLLQHEPDDPSYYDRHRLLQDTRSRQEARPHHHHHHHHQTPQGSRTTAVVRDPNMVRHVRLGGQLLRRQSRYNDGDNFSTEDEEEEDCRDLLETILLFEVCRGYIYWERRQN